MIELFSIFSGLILFISYVFYFRQVKESVSTPNPSSWLIWAFVMIINATTYRQVLVEDPIKAITGYVAVACIVFMCLYSLRQHKFTRVQTIDIFIFAAALATGIFWQVTGNAFVAQLALQSILLISYIPTYVGLIQGRAKEDPRSWILVVVAYIFSILAIIVNYQGNWIELLFPIVNGIIGNGLVALLVIYGRFQAKTKTP